MVLQTPESACIYGSIQNLTKNSSKRNQHCSVAFLQPQNNPMVLYAKQAGTEDNGSIQNHEHCLNGSVRGQMARQIDCAYGSILYASHCNSSRTLYRALYKKTVRLRTIYNTPCRERLQQVLSRTPVFTNEPIAEPFSVLNRTIEQCYILQNHIEPVLRQPEEPFQEYPLKTGTRKVCKYAEL